MTIESFMGFHAPRVAENIIFLDEIGSTNTYAKDLIKNGAPSGTTIITAIQTAGRGRLGRSWDGDGENIYMSTILVPSAREGSIAPQLTLLTGLCVTNVLNRLLANTPHKALIKWPNDIVIGRKKICGILTEGVMDAVVIGIGVNVGRKSFPPELADKGTSLYMLSEREHERAEIIKAILSEISAYYERFDMQGIGSFIDEYKALCLNIGKKVTIHENDTSYEALCLDVTDSGKLYVELPGGERRALNSGEVSVQGIYGSDGP